MLPLKISNICKSFGEKTVLDEINIEVKSGEIFGFIGLNGIGKTTLIKIILDLIDLDSGSLEIFGSHHFLPESRKKICYLPEKFQPSNYLKGEEFIKFVLDFYGKKFDQQKVKEICANLDLPCAALKERVTKYSKGMMQKLGLTAVFMSEADLIILDEPMSGLDPRARIFLKKQLMEYKKLGKTVFFSSHILSDMDEICDSIAVLNNKKIVFDGAPESFKARHQAENIDKAFLKEIGF